MFEDQFLDVFRQFPDAVQDKRKFTALMKDFFPEQPRQVNLICTVFDMGIVTQMETVNCINNVFAFRFVKKLMDEYGVSRLNADWAVSVWCVCYGKQVLHKPCEIEISKPKAGGSPTIRDEQGSGSRQYNDLFQYKAVPDGYGISGFWGDNARTLIFPNSHNGKPVTRILANAFANSEVQEAVMTDGISCIEERAFLGCRNLKQVILPGTLREIGDGAFSSCESLTTAALPKSLEQVGRYAFAGSALKQVILPAALLWLGDGAYMGCKRLASVQLPQHITELPPEVFKGCSALKKMTLPEGILSIGREAFADCTSLLDVIVPESVAQVGENAFAGMDPSFSLICTQKSAAKQYARRHNLPFQIVL